MKFLPLFFFMAAVSPVSGDTQMSYGSDFNQVNLQSDGVTPINQSFKFSLGNFRDGFTPTSANLDRWEEMWVSLMETNYREDFKLFSETALLGNNNAPFRTTDQVYIWGFNSKNTGSEWLLFSDSEWRWPRAIIGPPTPGGPEFQVASITGSEAILGNANGTGFQMQTARVVFNLSYSDWVAQVFDAGEASGPNDDPDGDGRDNLLEYALNSSPTTPDAESAITYLPSNQLEIARVPGRAVTWTLEVGETLEDFAPVEASDGVDLLIDEPSILSYQITDLNQARRFFRIVVSPS